MLLEALLAAWDRNDIILLNLLGLRGFDVDAAGDTIRGSGHSQLLLLRDVGWRVDGDRSHGRHSPPGRFTPVQAPQ